MMIFDDEDDDLEVLIECDQKMIVSSQQMTIRKSSFKINWQTTSVKVSIYQYAVIWCKFYLFDVRCNPFLKEQYFFKRCNIFFKGAILSQWTLERRPALDSKHYQGNPILNANKNDSLWGAAWCWEKCWNDDIFPGGACLLCDAHLPPNMDLLLPPTGHQVKFVLGFSSLFFVQDEQSAVYQVHLSLYQPHVPSPPPDHYR